VTRGAGGEGEVAQAGVERRERRRRRKGRWRRGGGVAVMAAAVTGASRLRSASAMRGRGEAMMEYTFPGNVGEGSLDAGGDTVTPLQ